MYTSACQSPLHTYTHVTWSSHQQMWVGNVCVFCTCRQCWFWIKICCCLLLFFFFVFFLMMSSVYAFALLCWQSGIEQIDTSAFFFNGRLSLPVLNDMLVCSQDIWWPQAFQKIEMICWIEKVVLYSVGVRYRYLAAQMRLVKDLLSTAGKRAEDLKMTAGELVLVWNFQPGQDCQNNKP